MATWSHAPTAQKIEIAVLGTPVRDAYVDVDALAFAGRQVLFQMGHAHFAVAYQGEPIRFGEKRFARCDLGGLELAGCTVRNGGGVYHTTAQLARLCAQRRQPVALSAIDSVAAWPQLAAAYAHLGVRHISLGLEHNATNLILTQGKPDRLILKSPDAPARLTAGQVEQLHGLLPAHLDALAINSPRSADLARAVLQAAQKTSAAQYSVLTPALPVQDRIELLLGRDRASVCNLSEFALLARAFGLACPADEETVRPEELAQVMAQLARMGKTGDLVVTLGAQGCLAGDRATGTLVHIGLHARHWRHVQEHVRAHPERRNGAGDRFFGSFVLSHLLAAHNSGNRTVQAARSASADMIRQLAPALRPHPNWFALRRLPQPFGAEKRIWANCHLRTNRRLPPGGERRTDRPKDNGQFMHPMFHRFSGICLSL
jgi:sugar/nucleoside kinase (ribokinase family)